MKLAVLLLAGVSYVMVWQKSIRWGTEVAVPGAAAAQAPATQNAAGIDVDVQAFATSSDTGTATLTGRIAGQRVLLLRDGQVIGDQQTPDGAYKFSLPLNDLLGANLLVQDFDSKRETSVVLDQGVLAGQFGAGKFATTYDVVQDAAVDSKFWLRFRGVSTSGDAIRMVVDGQPIGDIEMMGGRWETQLPFESVQGKLIQVGLLEGGAPVGEAVEVISTPTPEQFAAVPFQLVSPGDQAKLTVGPTVFDGTAAPGTVVLLYVDKYVVGKAIADPQGTWITTARIKSPGPTRKVRAATVPFRGVPATERGPHTVNFAPMAAGQAP